MRVEYFEENRSLNFTKVEPPVKRSADIPDFVYGLCFQPHLDNASMKFKTIVNGSFSKELEEDGRLNVSRTASLVL